MQSFFTSVFDGIHSPLSSPSASDSEDSDSETEINWAELTRPGIKYKIKSRKKKTETKEEKASKKLNLFVMGCPDNGVFPEEDGVCPQEKSSKLMAEVAKTTKPDLIVALGDNFEKHGVSSSTSKIFKTNFHDFLDKPELKDTPVIVLRGNHDDDANNGSVSFEKMDAQIRHTFINPKRLVDSKAPKYDKDKIRLYMPEKDAKVVQLDLEQMQKFSNKWTMPSRYHSIEWDDSVEMFCVDSNTLVRDFINYYLDGKKDSPENQAAWLFKAVKESTAETKLLFLHHPLRTIDKRNIRSDHPHYLTAAEYEQLEKAGIVVTKPDGTKSNYNEILEQILFIAENKEKGFDEGPGPAFTKIYAAHHHGLHYFNNKLSFVEEKKDEESKTPAPILKTNPKRYCQVVSGGQGGPLQYRHDFKGHKYIPAVIRDYGFTHEEIHYGKKRKTYSKIYSATKKTRLHFSDQSNVPIVDSPRDADLEKLGNLVKEACRSFHDYLCTIVLKPWVNGTQVYDWVPNCFVYSDDLINYFNSTNQPRFEEAVEYLHRMLTNCKEPRYIDGWFLTGLSEHFKKWEDIFTKMFADNYGITYLNFLNGTQKIPLTVERSPSILPIVKAGSLGDSGILLSPITSESPVPFGSSPSFFGGLTGLRGGKAPSPSQTPSKKMTEMKLSQSPPLLNLGGSPSSGPIGKQLGKISPSTSPGSTLTPLSRNRHSAEKKEIELSSPTFSSHAISKPLPIPTTHSPRTFGLNRINKASTSISPSRVNRGYGSRPATPSGGS